MPVDNRHFIIEDLPEDPEDSLCPDEDEEEEDDELMSNSTPVKPTFGAQPFIPSTPPPTPRAPWQQPSTIWPPSGTSTYRPPTPWGTPSFGTPQQQQTIQQQQRTQYTQSNQNRIDRRKRIVFCDLLDILVESESAVREAQGNYFSPSNNYRRTGVMPRGMYDVRLKLEVWSKISAFCPDYVFCITNQPEMSQEGLKSWEQMSNYVMSSLADYLRLPRENCRCFTKLGFDRKDPDVKPGIGLIKRALMSIGGGYRRKDMVVIGANSGYQNQSNIDRFMAEQARIDYVDVSDLLTIFY